MSSLPESIGALQKLQALDLRDCYELSTLPSSLTLLTRLTRPALEGCAQINTCKSALQAADPDWTQMWVWHGRAERPAPSLATGSSRCIL